MFLMAFFCCFISQTPFYTTFFILMLSGSLGLIGGCLISKWLFISIFMIFLGGMMILFFYVVSLAKPQKNTFFFNPTNFSIIFFLSLLIPQEWNIGNNKFLLFNMYNFLSFQCLIYMAFILFVTLFAVVKITENFKGSLLSSW